jgi:thymidylate synthase (FAD)
LRQSTQSDLWRTQAKSNKQGSGDYLVEDDDGAYCGKVLSEEEEYLHKLSNRVYEHRLEAGVAREQARKDLPLSTYTEIYWKMDLKNLLHYLSLRCDSHAQLEIRSYANIIAGIVKEICPITFEAWLDYHFCAKTFSRLELIELDSLVDGIELLDLECSDLSKREVEEFRNKIHNLTDAMSPPDFTLNLDDSKPFEYFEEMK